MKKILLMLLALMATFYFTGCKKVIDEIHQNPRQDFQFCDIKKFKVWFRDSYNEFTVTYNNKGQPKDVIGKYPDSPLHNFSYDQHFRYDKQGRLTDWITNPPGQQHVFVWNTYHYLSDARIVDSLYYGWEMPSYITDKYPPYKSNVRLVRFMDFDSYGRVVKISAPISDPDTTLIINIKYDAKGNSDAYAAYDSGVNIMRTNKIWMLVNFNYNVNNYTSTLGAGGHIEFLYSYNSYLLPITIEYLPVNPFEDGVIFMTSFAMNKMAIEYDCKGSPKYY